MSNMQDTIAHLKDADTLAEVMEELQGAAAALWDASDRRFLNDLGSFYEKKGYLSDKQLFHIARFHAALERSSVSAKTVETPAKEETPTLPQIRIYGEAICKLFDTAASFLKSPKLVYKVLPKPIHGIENLVFYRTGEKSHEPGSVGVVNGALAPDNQLLATIYRDKPARFYTYAIGKPVILQLIKSIAENPAHYLRFNGKDTGICCFCSRTLTDERSITAGYGPVCAGNWGLPWGEDLPQLRTALP